MWCPAKMKTVTVTIQMEDLPPAPATKCKHPLTKESLLKTPMDCMCVCMYMCVYLLHVCLFMFFLGYPMILNCLCGQIRAGLYDFRIPKQRVDRCCYQSLVMYNAHTYTRTYTYAHTGTQAHRHTGTQTNRNTDTDRINYGNM